MTRFFKLCYNGVKNGCKLLYFTNIYIKLDKIIKIAYFNYFKLRNVLIIFNYSLVVTVTRGRRRDREGQTLESINGIAFRNCTVA